MPSNARRPSPWPRVILFDALGTLVALEPPAPRLQAELASRLGLEVTEAQASQAVAAEISYYRGHLDEGRDPDSLATLRRRCAGVLRDALPAPELDLDRLAEALLASLRFTTFPDVAPALIGARGHGRRLVVVSNWDVSLNGVLAALELAPLLDGIVTSAVAGARKPSPAIFEHALALVRAEPAEAIHVGDSLEEDVAGARAAGIEPVLIRRSGDGAGGGVPAGAREGVPAGAHEGVPAGSGGGVPAGAREGAPTGSGDGVRTISSLAELVER
jgi:putative hydrolase of the HAD superfamily